MSETRKMINRRVYGVVFPQSEEERNSSHNQEENPRPRKGMTLDPDEDKEKRQDTHVAASLPEMPCLWTSPIGLIDRIAEYIGNKKGKDLFGM
jgi:hypothetical protein